MFKTDNMKNFLLSERRNRKFLLEGNLWQVIFYFTVPIIIYWVFQNISDSVELFILKRGKATDSIITFINRVHLFKGLLIPFGISIATGGVVLVGRAYGQNNIEKMRLYLAKTFILAILTGLLLAFLSVFVFQQPILDLLGPSKDHMLGHQEHYYQIVILSIICIIINTVFLALERAKGNNKIALLIIFLNAIIKISLSFFLYKAYDRNISSLAWASLIANGIITLFALWCLFLNRNNPFRIFLSKFSCDKYFIIKLSKIAVPICASITVYNLGKLVVSVVVREYYGTSALTSAAIGVNLSLAVAVNNIFYSILNSFSDSQNAIISQNLGHNNLDRVLQAFKKILLSMFILALLGTFIHIFGYKLILSFVGSKKWDDIPPLEQQAFKLLLFFETTSLWLSCTSIILFNFLLSFKKVAPGFYLNFLRTVCRIIFIVLFSNNFLDLQVVGIGLSIFLSNVICLIATLWIFIPFYVKLKKERIFERD